MTSKPTFADLLEAAKKGEWDIVDAHLKDEDISAEDYDLAYRVLMIDVDDNVRDFAATVFMVSSRELGFIDYAKLRAWMEEDPYDIVRYRLAMALYKRGYRSPDILAKVEEARHNKDVGSLAEQVLAST